MRIGIIGKGSVGSTLGSRWESLGHEVRYGSREPASSIRAAAEFGEIIVLAIPWPAVPDAIAAAGDLHGKVLLDCTNPIRADFSGLDLGENGSAGEMIAELSLGAKVVKVFNTVGYNVMANPDFNGQAASMLYCGDDDEAKRITASLAYELGFAPIDAGLLSQSRWLESLAWLWITLAVKQGFGREIAFELIRREARDSPV